MGIGVHLNKALIHVLLIAAFNVLHGFYRLSYNEVAVSTDVFSSFLNRKCSYMRQGLRL